MVEQLFKNDNPQPTEYSRAPQLNEQEQNSSKLVDWIVKHRKTFASAFVAVCFLGVLAVWQITAQSANRAKDFEQAHFLAEDLEKNSFSSSDDDNEASRNSILQRLTLLNDTYPDLHKRYDGIIAQEYILEQNENKIDPYAKRAIDQLQAVGLTQYAQFAEISRLVAKSKLHDALQAAKTLYAKLKEQANSKTFALRAYTLVELVGIHKKLGSDLEAASALQEARLLLEESPTVQLSEEEQEMAGKIRKELEEENNSLLEFL